MTKSNVPRNGEIASAQRRSPSAPPQRRFSPTSVLGWGLVAGGLASFAFSGGGSFGLLACAAGAVTVIFKRFNKRISTDGNELPEQPRRHLKELRRFIGKTRYLENVGDWGEQAAEQLLQVSLGFDQFQQLLALKFERHELTFARYHAAAEQVYRGVLDNLELVATMLNNADAVNPRDLKERISELASGSERADEIRALEERIRLREEGMATVRELLFANELAITELDRVRAALAETQTRKNADVALDLAMAQLAQLAERARMYDINRQENGG